MDWRTRRILDNLWGPLGTLLIHVVVIALLVRFMVVEERREGTEVEVMIREIEPPPELEQIEEELEILEDVPTVVEAVAPPEVSMDREPPRVDAISPTASDATALDQMDIMAATSPIQFRGLYASRSAGGRQAALGKYAGGLGGRTEYAVKKALKWLRDHQYPDGSWGPRYRAGMTGMALLAFLAHGETTASEEYGDAVRRGLQYLLKNQRNGMFIGGGPRWGRMTPGQIKCYEHAIASYAVAEAYGLTQIPFLRFAMEDAVQVMLDGQHAGGSWDYDYRLDPGAHIDTSLAGWHVQALKAAKMAGARNRGISSAIESAINGMKNVNDGFETGLFRYGTRLREEESDVAMTGVAVLCMQLTGFAMDPDARAGIQALRKFGFRWARSGGPGEEESRHMGNWPFYGWYYITQARFHQGGKTWEQWNREFAPVLCEKQNEDGSWPPAPRCGEARYGPVYTTSLAALMLQVYYRLLPTYQEIEVDDAPMEDAVPAEEEVIIRFG